LFSLLPINTIYQCTYIDTGISYPAIKLFVVVDTKFAMNYQIYNDNGIIVTNISQFLFDEGKKYTMTLSQDQITKPTTTEDGSHYLYLLPILYAAIVLIGTFTVWLIGNIIYSKLKKRGLLHWKRVDREIDQVISESLFRLSIGNIIGSW
jgi:hypothetical protein